MNNDAIPDDWKKDKVVPIYKEGDRSVVETTDRLFASNWSMLELGT
jgi:hypothetical protein